MNSDDFLGKILVSFESYGYSLGQYCGQGLECYHRHIIYSSCPPCEQPVFGRGMGLAVPRNPTESGKSISPVEGVVVL